MSPQSLHAWEMQKPRLFNFCLFEQEHCSSEQQPYVSCSTYCSFEHLGDSFEQPSTPYFAQLFAPFSFYAMHTIHLGTFHKETIPISMLKYSLNMPTQPAFSLEQFANLYSSKLSLLESSHLTHQCISIPYGEFGSWKNTENYLINYLYINI